MATETLRFVLELYSEFWKRPPKVDIYVNGQSKYSSEITETKDKPHTVDFTHSFTEGDKISLVIDRQNKSSTDTLVENNTIKKDQLLHIKSIAIDEIDIGDQPINERFSKVDDYIKSNYSGNEKKTLEQWTNELSDPQKGLGLELRDSGKLESVPVTTLAKVRSINWNPCLLYTSPSPRD